jgi:hypothetical protein
MVVCTGTTFNSPDALALPNMQGTINGIIKLKVGIEVGLQISVVAVNSFAAAIFNSISQIMLLGT